MSYRILLASETEEEGRRWARALEPLKQLHVVGAVCGKAALLQGAAERTPNLILLKSTLLDDAGHASPTLRQLGLSARLIVVGAEASFADACAALRCRAEDFLVLPLSDAALRAAVSEVLGRMHSQTAALPMLEYRKVIGRLFLDRARITLQDNHFPVEIVNNLYDTHFQDDAYRMLVVRINSVPSSSPLQLSEWLEDCVTTLYHALSPLCHEILLRYAQKRVHILLNYAADNEPALLGELEGQLQSTLRALPPEMTVAFCCSERHDSIQDIGQMAEESMDVAWSSFVRETDTLLLKQTDPPCSPHIRQLYATAEQELKRACYELNLPAFQKALRTLFSQPDYIVGRSETRHLIRRVEFYMLETNRDLISAYANVDMVKQSILQALQTSSSLSEYTQKYTACLTSLFQRILSQIGGRQSRHIRLAKQYIEGHLNAPIHLQEVADWVDLSPVYLSALFKKEAHCNFSDYVNICRVEAAKQLLQDDHAKIQTIAASLGYYDSRYFSRVFKSITGMKPTEYRSALQEKAAAKPS